MPSSPRPRHPNQDGRRESIELQIYGETTSLTGEHTVNGQRFPYQDVGMAYGSSNSMTLPTRSRKKQAVRFDGRSEPERTNAYCTIKRTRFSSMRIKKAAMSHSRDDLDDKVVIENISADPELNKTDPESEQLRMEVIRDIHCSLHKKRRLKNTVSEKINEEAAKKLRKRIGRGTSMRFKMKQGFRIVKAKVGEAFRVLDLWRGQLRTIEGHFGGSVAYYFYFLQQLVFLNIIIFMISISFILLPQLLYKSSDPFTNQTEANSTYGQFPLPEPTPPSPFAEIEQLNEKHGYSLVEDDEEEDSDPEFWWMDVFTGTGYLDTTELYYGAYVNYTISVVSGYYYNLPLAYLLATVVHLIVCLCLLARWVANAYKKHIEFHAGYGVHTFCNIVFCAWDFSIVSDKAAKYKRIGIHEEFQEKLQFVRKDSQRMTWLEKLVKFLRIFLNFALVVGILAGIGTIVWYLLKMGSFQVDNPVLTKMTLPLTITLILVFLPFAFTLMLLWEGYREKSTEVYVTMIRMMLLLMTILGVLCYFWFSTDYSSTDKCWENRLGEELYRLLLMDFVIVNIFSILFRIIYTGILHKNSEFNLAWNTWNLIYTQMLCWLGSLYFPMISGLVIIKLLLTFYIKQLHIKLGCTPPAKPWGASQTKIIFLSFASLGLVAMLFPVGYSIIAMTPSQHCGPFQGREYVYDVIIEVLRGHHVSSETLKDFMYFVSLPGCVAAILIVLSAIAFQARSYAKATRNLVDRMQHQLQLEAKDKVFLSQMLDRATKALENRSTANTTSRNGNTVRFRESTNQESIPESSPGHGLNPGSERINNGNKCTGVQMHLKPAVPHNNMKYVGRITSL